MNERRPGSLFQILEATDENDLDLAIAFKKTKTAFTAHALALQGLHTWTPAIEIVEVASTD